LIKQRTTWQSLWGSLLVIVLISACSSSDSSENPHDRLVAKAYNKSLFASELNDLIVAGTPAKDSAQIANAYIEKWIREAVLMHEAEKYVPKDLNIDELVRDYRASLIRHNYEKLLVENNLDSTITETELQSHYEEYKEEYKLRSPILKCNFIKLPKPVEQLNDVKDWWRSDKEGDFKKLVDYCSRNAALYLLNDSLWYDLKEISVHLPQDELTENNYRSKRNLTVEDEDFNYFLRIVDTTPAGEYSPLDYVKDRANKVILHKRKNTMLERKKEEMYEVATSKNQVKVMN
jgi:hypothetical protein